MISSGETSQILDVNLMFSQLTGWAREDVVGQYYCRKVIKQNYLTSASSTAVAAVNAADDGDEPDELYVLSAYPEKAPSPYKQRTHEAIWNNQIQVFNCSLLDRWGRVLPMRARCWLESIEPLPGTEILRPASRRTIAQLALRQN